MIVCCGEALCDFLEDASGGRNIFEARPGGSIFNVAIALGRLNVPVGFFGGLSTDVLGDLLTRELRASGVSLTHVRRCNRPSTIAIVVLDRGKARYVFQDQNSAGRMLTAGDLPRLSERVSALHLGSFSLAVEPCGTAFEKLVHREEARRVISIDPNIRPAMVENRRSYLARLKRLMAVADIVKMSDEDLDWMTGGEDHAIAAGRLMRGGAKIVIVTHGARGATAFTRRFAISVPAVKVRVADTVGAGDSFSAGFLAAMRTNKHLTKRRLADIGEIELRQALGFASRVAALTCARRGADPPRLADIA